MTNNTIPNVPRELLERLRSYIPNGDGYNSQYANDLADAAEAIERLSAPSPAGVDGLKVVGYVSQDDIKWQGDCTLRLKPYSDYVIPLCHLSDAQAIIDGLAAENHQLRRELNLRQSQIKSSGRIAERAQRFAVQLRTERDQQAQRIGELEGLLRAESARVDFLDAYIVTADAPDTGKAAMLADSGTLRECIDAALSAGKEGE